MLPMGLDHLHVARERHLARIVGEERREVVVGHLEQ